VSWHKPEGTDMTAAERIRDKRLAAVIAYFVKETKNCKKTKLGKLLFFLDFLHFKRFGTSVTGNDYVAMPKGPVPIQLYRSITDGNLPEEIARTLAIEEEMDEYGESKGFRISVRPRAQVEMDLLSPRELAVMEEVAFIFHDSSATEMSEITHLRNTPWERTLKERGKNAIIDYRLAIDDDVKLGVEELLERFKIQKELQSRARA
jgi:uncharacterized phage-associated protein